MTSNEDPNENEPIDRARRLLMKSAVYAAPVVISFIQVNRAAAQASRCGPDFICNPGHPCNPGNCMPHN